MKYRTKEQYEDIMDSAYNGNWSEASKLGANTGFTARDLLEYLEDGTHIPQISHYTTIAYLAEGIASYKMRNNP
jgi:hypothetical protein